MFLAQFQAFARGREYRQSRRSPKQRGDQFGGASALVGAAQHVFDVVEHEQQLLLTQVVDDLLAGRTYVLLAGVERKVQRFGERGHNLLRRAERRQRDEVYPIRIAFGREQLLGQRDGEAGLGYAAGAGGGGQTGGGLGQPPGPVGRPPAASGHERGGGRA